MGRVTHANRPPQPPTFQRRLSRLEHAAANALEVMRFGRLGPREGAPYEVVHRERHYRLRRYGVASAAAGRPAILLVPPLMVTAEVYDVAPELSAVAFLASEGVDPWVVDFGAPEREEGGMSRTLDDHVRAVADAVRRVRAITGRDVHIAGYSQGGMFAYQAAAYLGSEGIASIITFGSPVDIHKNLPNVGAAVAGRIIEAARPLVEPTLRSIEGLPGVITSTAFKIVSARRELAQLVDFVQKLHDRQALVKREARRRFLGGEGFVAWPGPALRTFVDEFIVHNRMISGGFVVDGRTFTLADVRSPVLYFVGLRDEIARPRAVRAIAGAAPRAETFEVGLPAGHFGLVVGSTANRSTWPTVAAWLRWRDGLGPRPSLLPAPTGATQGSHDEHEEEVENAAIVASLDIELFYDVVAEALGSAWNKLGEAVVDLGDTADALRYQLPRLMRLRRMADDTLVSVGRALASQARDAPERTFFLWKGRAFSYGDADRRVDNVLRGLFACGVRPGDRVAVIMRGRPSYLTMVTALNRLGAVSVLVSPRLDDPLLARALAQEAPGFVAADPENAARARASFAGPVLVLGGGGPSRTLAPGLIDMEAIDPRRRGAPRGPPPEPRPRGRSRGRPGHAGRGRRAAGGARHQPSLGALGARRGRGLHAHAGRHRLLLPAAPPPRGPARLRRRRARGRRPPRARDALRGERVLGRGPDLRRHRRVLRRRDVPRARERTAGARGAPEPAPPLRGQRHARRGVAAARGAHGRRRARVLRLDRGHAGARQRRRGEDRRPRSTAAREHGGGGGRVRPRARRDHA